MALLSSADSLTCSILDTIPPSLRPSAAAAISVIHCASRALTAAEVSSALAVEIASVDLESINQNSLIDIEFDFRRSLAGLVYEKEGYFYILHPSLKNILNHKAPDSSLSWLNTDPQAEMKMASICLQSISTWTQYQEGRKIVEEDISAEKWPLLDYAVKFWHEYFERAMDASAKAADIKLVVRDWGVVRSWMQLWRYVHSCPESEKDIDLSASRLYEIAISFEIAVPKAIQAILLILQALPLLDGNEKLAGIWVAWQLNNDRPIPGSWKQTLQDSASLSILLNILSLAPWQTFQLLDMNKTFVTSNGKAILLIALQQGVVAIVERCWPLVLSDEVFTAKLPWVS